MSGFLHQFSRLEIKRRHLLKSAPEGPMRDYLSQPFPSRRKRYEELRYLALDTETTGLDDLHDQILSIGYVPIDGLGIHLRDAAYHLVKPYREIPEQSVVIHGLTDDEVYSADSIESVLPKVLKALKGRVLIAHYASLDLRFLGWACRRTYRCPLLVPVIDTLDLEYRTMRHRNQYPKKGEMTLDALRVLYNLPRYRAHNALSDALAAGELFMAQASHRAGRRRLLFGDLAS
ncbi:MAG: 3'-5' exonuclease [Magnetococcales bacterium]|nr:3'-5' exonuclease [Magnetococcales bacterium]